MNRPRDPDDPTGISMLRVREVCDRLSVSVSYVYSLIALGLFPKFVPLGPKSCGLPEHVLDAWLWQCLQLRVAMSSLCDPVQLPPWRPGEIEGSPVRGIRMLRLPVVVARVGLAKSHIYRQIGAEMFSQPAPLGPRVRRWAAHEIDSWLRQRVEMLGRIRDLDWYLRPPREDDDDDDHDDDSPTAA